MNIRKTEREGSGREESEWGERGRREKGRQESKYDDLEGGSKGSSIRDEGRQGEWQAE